MALFLRRARYIAAGLVVGAGIYFGPFLPSPRVWPQALYNGFQPSREALHRIKDKFDSSRLLLGEVELQETHDQQQGLKLSVVIPVYNEGCKSITNLLERLDAYTTTKLDTEVIVVDGGSSDDSMDALQCAKSKIPIHATSSTGGRGPALSRGVEVSDGDIILFLHADTVLPKGYDEILREEFSQNEDVVMTAFQFKFNLEEELFDPSLLNGIHRLEKFTNIRAKTLWLPYGDQALAIRRKTLLELGGVKQFKMMEDFDLVTRVRYHALATGKRIEILPHPALCSARRHAKHGLVYTTMLNWLFVTAYMWLGMSPDRIYKLYYGSHE